jgi:hypothetical protein
MTTPRDIDEKHREDTVDLPGRAFTIPLTVVILPDSSGHETSNEPCGRVRLRTARETGAEGATAPETLRQTDRRGMKLWKAAAP